MKLPRTFFYRPFSVHVFYFTSYVISRISGSQNRCTFNFIRNYHTVFQSGNTTLYPYHTLPKTWHCVLASRKLKCYLTDDTLHHYLQNPGSQEVGNEIKCQPKPSPFNVDVGPDRQPHSMAAHSGPAWT